MHPDSKRWRAVTPLGQDDHPIALTLIADHLPDRDPFAIWSGFEFFALDGASYAVDMLVLTPVGLFLLEILPLSGALAGDETTWHYTSPAGESRVIDPPQLQLGRKARALDALLREQPGLRTRRDKIPTIAPLIFACEDEIDLTALTEAGRRLIVQNHPRPEVGLESALLEARFLGAHGAARATLRASDARAIGATLEAIGIRRQRRHRRVGPYELGALIFEGPGFQDFLGQHVDHPDRQRRIRRYGVARQATASQRDRVARAARREMALLAQVEHPGLVRALDLIDTESGPCLLFEHDPRAVRLDRYLAGPGARLDHATRLDLLARIGDAVRYMHRRRVFHRALSPEAVLVVPAASGPPEIRIFCWQTAQREEGTSSGTTHVQALIASTALPYLAPEVTAGRGHAGEEADIFSLGALAWLLFTGAPPAGSLADLRLLLREREGLRPSTITEIDPELDQLIYDATRQRVDARISSVDVLLARLDRLRADEIETVVDDPLDARPGDIVDPGYRVKRRLGSGATAIALLVTDRDRESRVLKVPRDQSAQRRLRDEYEVLTQLHAERRHPHIVQAFGLERVGAREVLVLEWAGDETLRDRLRTEGALAQELLENVGGDLIDTVRALDAAGIAHRDLKPENIAIRKGGTPERLRPVLIDFSLSRAPADQVRVGTAAYRDPFLDLPDRLSWDWKAEYYGLAVVLYEMATGTLPTWGDDRSDPAFADDPHPHIEAERFAPGLREGLSAFFRRALARDVSKRFETGEAMLRVWRSVFADAEREDERQTETRPTDLTLDTPVSLLGLSGRAISALHHAEIDTLATLLATPPGRLRFLRGVGAKTRSELVNALERFAPLRSEALAHITPTVSETATLTLEALVARLERGRETAATIRDLYLGLTPWPGRPATAWPSVTETAERLAQSRNNVTNHLSRIRQIAAADPDYTTLRNDLVALLDDAGGAALADHLVDAIRRTRPTDYDDPEALRLANAITRIAIDAEAADDSRRLIWRREGDKVIIARNEAYLDWARALGHAADALAAENPLPPTARVLRVLAEIDPPDGPAAIDPIRRLHLAVATAEHAALSSRQEIYPRRMPADRALRLGLGALLGRPALTVDQIQNLIARRYPEAEPLPDRPALDAHLEAAEFPLRYDEAQRRYIQRTTPSTATLLSRSAHPLQSFPGPDPDKAAPRSPAHLARLDFEARLADASEPGAWTIFVTSPRDHEPAIAELCSRFGAIPHSLDAALLDALRAIAHERRIPWPTLLEADRHPQDSRHGQRLRLVIRQAIERVEHRLTALAPDRPLLLHEAGLLARYGAIDLLTRLREAITTGRLAASVIWIIIPGDQQEAGARLDGAIIPTVTPAQVARIPTTWLNVQAA